MLVDIATKFFFKFFCLHENRKEDNEKIFNFTDYLS